MNHRYFGTAGQIEQQNEAPSIAVLVERALRPVADSVGLDERVLAAAVERDLSRRVARAAFDALEQKGVAIRSVRVLDMGAGLGQTSVEARLRGADVVAIEPGPDWCRVVSARMAEVGGRDVLVADGEQMPFRDESFDVVMSVAVLEHVKRPAVYLREAFRVLRPGGHLFLTCENYLGFWEPHYQVRWLPLFPKPLAAVYLRLLGRSSEFLLSSITYTTRPKVNRMLRAVGFEFVRELEIRRKLEVAGGAGPGRMKAALGSMRRIFGPTALARAFFEVENARALFSTYYGSILRKPATTGHRWQSVRAGARKCRLR